MIQSKLPAAGTTIFTVMSSLAQQHQAINLSQGFPDFEMPQELIAHVNEAMLRGQNQYAPMPGLLPLREMLAQKVHELYGVSVNPDTEITIAPGGTLAIYTAITTVVRPGDEVIVLEPAYDSYIPNIELNGGKVITVPLQTPDYSVNWPLVAQSITPRTRLIIINTPHNPCGYVWTREDMQQLDQLLAGKDIYVVSDEVYEHLTFDNRRHETILSWPNLRSRAFACYSFGKVFNNTGWKMGYCIAPEPLMKEYRKVHQFLCFSCNTPVQAGMAAFLHNKDHYLQLSAFMQEKRNYFLDLMKGSRFTLHQPSNGSYFQVMGYEQISQQSDLDFARWLTEAHQVATIPVSAFYQQPKDDHMIRFCFAKKNETLEQAAERLIKV
jgi:methionine aminotransferase